MDKLQDCKRVFSNGTEYEVFLDSQCMKCVNFRKGHCKIFRRCEMARWDEKYFPYADLMEYECYAGKYCKKFTTEKPVMKRHRRELRGQLAMEDLI